MQNRRKSRRRRNSPCTEKPPQSCKNSSPFIRLSSLLPRRWREMASEHDRAVLQAIFHPGSPLGDTGPAVNSEEELTDDGETPLPI